MAEQQNNDLVTAFKSLVKWTAALYLIVVIAGIATFAVRQHDIAKVEEASVRNTAAFCALREDLRRRVATSRDFLDEHPGGIPGISPETIQQNIENQLATIEALRIVNCREVGE